MDWTRRTFLHIAGGLGLGTLASSALGRADEGAASAHDGRLETESRHAFDELLDLLRKVDREYLSPERRVASVRDVSDGHRLIMHLLEGGIDLNFEADPERPVFKRIVSPTRKRNGDNPDAIYLTAAIKGNRAYWVRGNLAGATYTSLTIEAGRGEGHYASRTAAVINDTQFESDRDGGYELLLAHDASGPNSVKLDSDAIRLTTRHYFERERSVAADPWAVIPLSIEPVAPVGPPPDWNDARIAAGIRRVANDLRGRTLEQPLHDPSKMPAWVSRVPNRFNPPEKPGNLAFAARDAAYSMAPFRLGPDEALVMQGRFPECRFANVVLWNRYLQTYDYVHRQVSLNRKQVELDSDGRYRIVVAHRNPGVPNWLDTLGRSSGTIYWRFMLPEGEVPTPTSRVMPIDAVAKAA